MRGNCTVAFTTLQKALGPQTLVDTDQTSLWAPGRPMFGTLDSYLLRNWPTGQRFYDALYVDAMQGDPSQVSQAAGMGCQKAATLGSLLPSWVSICRPGPELPFEGGPRYLAAFGHARRSCMCA